MRYFCIIKTEASHSLIAEKLIKSSPFNTVQYFRNKCLSILKIKLLYRDSISRIKIERNINRINDRWLVILFLKKRKKK